LPLLPSIVIATITIPALHHYLSLLSTTSTLFRKYHRLSSSLLYHSIITVMLLHDHRHFYLLSVLPSIVLSTVVIEAIIITYYNHHPHHSHSGGDKRGLEGLHYQEENHQARPPGPGGVWGKGAGGNGGSQAGHGRLELRRLKYVGRGWASTDRAGVESVAFCILYLSSNFIYPA
jgi:hypothetical protein